MQCPTLNSSYVYAVIQLHHAEVLRRILLKKNDHHINLQMIDVHNPLGVSDCI